MQYEDEYLEHYGVPGQKWGVRRYQDKEGRLTREGREHYGYKNDPSGKFNGIKSALNVAKVKTSNVAKNFLAKKKAERANKKPVSKLTDQELRERVNRLQMEQQLKRLQDEASGKNKPEKSFSEKHPLLKKVILDTATNTLANVASSEFQTLADELLAKKRMERAKQKGMLDESLTPFVSPKTAARITMYNKGKEAAAEREKAVQKRISEAIIEERATHQKNLEKAVDIARKEERESHQRNLDSVARASKAQADRRMQDVLNVIRTTNKNQGNAKARSAVNSTVDAISKMFMSRDSVSVNMLETKTKYDNPYAQAMAELFRNRGKH